MTSSPALGYHGADSFTFKVNDGNLDSTPATVSITINAVNHPPVANAQTVVTNEDAAKAITLTGSDPDGDPVTYAVVANPTHGTLSGAAPNLTYTPALGYHGPDSFTYKVNDEETWGQTERSPFFQLTRQRGSCPGGNQGMASSAGLQGEVPGDAEWSVPVRPGSRGCPEGAR